MSAHVSKQGPERPSMRPHEPGADLMAANVTATMVTGPIVFTLIGWFADKWLGTKPIFVLCGLLVGMALALYIVWIRYGTGGQPSSADTVAPSTPEQGGTT